MNTSVILTEQQAEALQDELHMEDDTVSYGDIIAPCVVNWERMHTEDDVSYATIIYKVMPLDELLSYVAQLTNNPSTFS